MTPTREQIEQETVAQIVAWLRGGRYKDRRTSDSIMQKLADAIANGDWRSVPPPPAPVPGAEPIHPALQFLRLFFTKDDRGVRDLTNWQFYRDEGLRLGLIVEVDLPANVGKFVNDNPESGIVHRRRWFVFGPALRSPAGPVRATKAAVLALKDAFGSNYMGPHTEIEAYTIALNTAYAVQFPPPTTKV